MNTAPRRRRKGGRAATGRRRAKLERILRRRQDGRALRPRRRYRRATTVDASTTSRRAGGALRPQNYAQEPLQRSRESGGLRVASARGVRPRRDSGPPPRPPPAPPPGPPPARRGRARVAPVGVSPVTPRMERVLLMIAERPQGFGGRSERERQEVNDGAAGAEPGTTLAGGPPPSAGQTPSRPAGPPRRRRGRRAGGGVTGDYWVTPAYASVAAGRGCGGGRRHGGGAVAWAGRAAGRSPGALGGGRRPGARAARGPWAGVGAHDVAGVWMRAGAGRPAGTEETAAARGRRWWRRLVRPRSTPAELRLFVREPGEAGTGARGGGGTRRASANPAGIAARPERRQRTLRASPCNAAAVVERTGGRPWPPSRRPGAAVAARPPSEGRPVERSRPRRRWRSRSVVDSSSGHSPPNSRTMRRSRQGSCSGCGMVGGQDAAPGRDSIPDHASRCAPPAGPRSASTSRRRRRRGWPQPPAVPPRAALAPPSHQQGGDVEANPTRPSEDQTRSRPDDAARPPPPQGCPGGRLPSVVPRGPPCSPAAGGAPRRKHPAARHHRTSRRRRYVRPQSGRPSGSPRIDSPGRPQRLHFHRPPLPSGRPPRQYNACVCQEALVWLAVVMSSGLRYIGDAADASPFTCWRAPGARLRTRSRAPDAPATVAPRGAPSLDRHQAGRLPGGRCLPGGRAPPGCAP